jgi:hypothetical protein
VILDLQNPNADATIDTATFPPRSVGADLLQRGAQSQENAEAELGGINIPRTGKKIEGRVGGV